MDVLPIIP